MGLTGVVPGANQAPPALPGIFRTQSQGPIGGKPPTAPLVVAVSAIAGNIEAGTRIYAYSFTATGGPPTVPGPQVTSGAFSAGNAQGALSAIAVGPAGTTERRIWRSKANPPAAGAPLYLCGIISDNVTTTFTDNTSDTDLGDLCPVMLVADDYLQHTGILDGVGGAIIGPSGSTILNVQIYSVALTPVAVAANTTAEQIFAVAGLTAADKILFVNKPTAQAGLGIVGFRVSSAGNIGITFANVTAAAITPTAAESYLIGAIRS
jgi:hypothetical protein